VVSPERHYPRRGGGMIQADRVPDSAVFDDRRPCKRCGVMRVVKSDRVGFCRDCMEEAKRLGWIRWDEPQGRWVET